MSRSTHGVAVPAPTRWCPECRSAGVVGIEQDVCPTCDGTGKIAAGVGVPQVRLIGTACTSDPCEREQQCRKAGSCRRAVDSWASLPKDGEWPCEECGKPEKEHIGTGQQCPSGAKRFFPADPDGVREERSGCECAACKVTPHASDCAVHNEPAMPAGPCDCGAPSGVKEDQRG